jgi:transcriptional regulator with XRE-family HTH domain
MVATINTAVPLPSGSMRTQVHNADPQAVLARNLSAAFKKRGLSARSVARSLQAAGMKISNKTVSNMLNGEGNPQLDNLAAVARHVKIPLWQLLCPAIDISHLSAPELSQLIEGIVGLSETGQAQVRRTIRLEALAAREDAAESAT